MEITYVDSCAWCKHPLKVYVLSWMTVKSHKSIPLVANYCDEKVCREEGCTFTCEEVALSTPEGEEKVLHEIIRRKRKMERQEEEAAGANS